MISLKYKKLNSINIKKWVPSYCSRLKDILYNILKNNNNLSLPKLLLLYKQDINKENFIISKIRYIDLDIDGSNNKQIIFNWFYNKNNIQKIFKYTKINEPSDENIQIGILIGLIYPKEKYDKNREIISIKLAKVTHSHPYNYLSILTLANIISYTIIHDYNIINGLLASKDYLNNKYKCNNKIEFTFVKDYNNYINSLINSKKNIINIKYHSSKKKTTLTTLQFAITSYLDSPDNWKMILANACIQRDTNPNTGAIACSFYGLINGLKNVHPNMLT